MAESDGKPASSPLSSEEADRLSEKFKPSWEAEPDPPTIPKVEPPVISNVEPPTIPKVDPPKNPLAKQTLLGIAAPSPEPRPAEPPTKPADDLDWELPTNPAPEQAAEAQPIEPPPKSSPSGVGQTYVPKDVDAPPIVLKEEVKRAEEVALAQLDAEHKARSAPTVLKFKAIESPQKAAADELDPDVFVAPKRGLGVYIGLGAGAILVALIGIMVVVKSTTSEAPEPQPTEVKAAEPTPKPEPAPPPPPVVTAAPTPTPAPEPKAAEPVVEPVSEPKALEPPKVEPKPAPEPAPPPPKPVAAPKAVPTSKPAAAPKAPKPVSTTPKAAPASKPAAQKPASGGIVRDVPF